MKYEKVSRDKYNIHLINTDRFKTTRINVAFSNVFNKKDIIYFSLLIRMLTTSTKKYKTTASLAIKGEELYGSEVFSYFRVNGNIERFVISLEFLNPKYTEIGMVKESIDFLEDCLFNPNVCNKEFDNFMFELNKKSIITSLKGLGDNPYSYAEIKFNKIMYENTALAYHLYDHIEELEKIENKDLYKFYLNMLKTFKIDIFVSGQLDSTKEYVKSLEDVFSKNSNMFNKNLNIEYNLNFTKLVTKKVKSNFTQSQLFIGYSIEELTDYEKKYVLYFYNSILGGINNSILFTEVREKNSLCYSINSSITKNPYSIVIFTEIDKNNYEKTLKLIDKSIEVMKDGKIIKSLYNSAKENINTALNMYYDDRSIMVEHYYKKEFDIDEDIEFKRKKYMNVTIDEVVNFAKKVRKRVIFFLEGDKS